MLQYLVLRLAIAFSLIFNYVCKRVWGFSFHSGPLPPGQRNATSGEKGVLRQRVLWRADFGELSPKNKNSMFLTFSGFESTDSLLLNEVTLLFLTEKRAYFVEVPKGFDVFDTSHAAFCYTAQFKNATHVLSLRLEDFLSFTKNLGNPKANVILLSNTGRCGSTLLTQMLEGVPNTLVMSEPLYFLDVLFFLDPKGPDLPEVIKANPQAIVHAGLRALCKPMRNRRIDHIVIKSMCQCIKQAASIAQEFPDVRHIFMHREPKSHIRSFRAVLSSVPRPVSQFLLPRFAADFLLQIAPDDTQYLRQIEDGIRVAIGDFGGCQFFLVFWCLILINYVEYKRHFGVDFYPLGYEELVADPRSKITEILRHCQMPLERLEDCLAALDKDSQRTSSLSRENLQKHKHLQFEPDDIIKMNKIMAKFDFPSIDGYMTIFD